MPYLILPKGLHFLQMLSELMNIEEKNSEIENWLNLLLGLVNVTDSLAVRHLQKFIPVESSGVLKEFRHHISKHVSYCK